MQSSPEILADSSPPEIITLDIGGMKCAGCVAAVERQLKQQPGVISARVNLATEVAAIEGKAGVVDAVAIAKKLTDTGFPTQPRYAEHQQEQLAAIVERRRQEIRQQIWQLAIALTLILLSGLGHLVGTETPIFSNIWFHCGLATAALLFPGRAILIDGWRGLWRNSPNMNTLVGLGAFTAYSASVIALLFPQMGWECFFDEPVMLLGFILLGKTLEQQAKRRAASALQALISLQPATANLVAKPQENTGSEENSELPLTLLTVEIPADRVRVGEWLQVLPGEKIPVDGEVCKGTTTVDESMLTGESVAVFKQRGDAVAAGTLNQSGAIVMRATRTGKETTLAQIVALVETAQTRKAPIQYLADTVAGYFCYSVMTISTLTFLFWYFAGTHIWPEVLLEHTAISMNHAGMNMIQGPLSPALLSLKLAIAVLAIACPCALGLATPTAILVGSGMGAERGLLIKGGDVLERVHQLDTIIFDKTGTLTTGSPKVTDCIAKEEGRGKKEEGRGKKEEGRGKREEGRGKDEEGRGKDEEGRGKDEEGRGEDEGGKNEELPISDAQWLLQIAATVESGTSHPLAEAILEEARQQGLSLLLAGDFYTQPGLGVSALVEGDRVLAGNADWLRQYGVFADMPSLTSLEGKTLVYVAVAGVFVGVIAVSDTLRPDAKTTIEKLRSMGLRVMLVTGDRREVAVAIAQQLDIGPDDILAEVRPQGKADAIAALQAEGHQVAMVGDGINDAPALAQADVGIGMQAGTDAAVETAQIVLMRDTLGDVVESIYLSRLTFNKIRQNLFWAFAYNVLGIPIAAGILLPTFGLALSPAAAGAFMAFSSVSVVTNSLLLRRNLIKN
ncbi:heavy metal translocating P-type ATPase [Kamptonema animale CS-326]|jgi:Cu2+-exporting ATPase|nr:heavy metal translocating P-type ATPase [Kamptonema animale]MDB9512033.1 heavy metal translocating P-type ATPase [Kamptonema animale CS-326]